MTARRNHRWGDPVYFEHKTERACINAGCSVVKVTRHEGCEHWTEFYCGLEKIAGNRAPGCEPITVMK